MKKLIYIFCISFLYGCVFQQKTNSDATVNSTKITPETVKFSMDYLASDLLEGRATGTKGLENAAVFIENYLEKNHIKPYFETYRDSFKVKGLNGYNIVGVIEGNDPILKHEYVILGGHYDHIGKSKVVDNDSIANGANDDASGTVVAMELGRYFAENKSNKRSLLITLYDAEELGLKGSEHLATRLKNENLDLYTMINFEMVGVPRAADKIMAYMSGFYRSNFSEVLNAYAKEEIIGYLPKAKAYSLFKRSDNFPFYNTFNIPAHAISTFDFENYEYYHHVDDEVDHMDYEHMANFINKFIPSIEGMINASTKEVKLTTKELILNDE